MQATFENQANKIDKIDYNIENNPLLNYNQLPQFDKIHANLLTPALDEALKKAYAALNIVENTKDITWRNIVSYLDESLLPLGYAWGVAKHLSSVCDSDEWRSAINDNLERITEFWTKLGQNEKIYFHYKTLLQNANELELNSTQIKILQDSILNFQLSGAELQGKDKEKFSILQTKQAIVCKKIADNVLDANDAFSYIINENNLHELNGVPEYILANLKQTDGSYKVSLLNSIYAPIMQYCTNRQLRQLLYKAYVTRACNITQYSQGKSEWDNAPLIHELLNYRQQEAKLLNYNNYAQISLATKMAKQPQKVLDFIDNIAQKAKPYALKEYEMLQQFAKTQNIENLEAWDIAYISELLRQKEYNFSEQEIQLYFTVPSVLESLFNIIQTLFKVKIVEKIASSASNISVWHEDVQFFDIVDEHEQVIAHFYLDLYARASKQSGAWMNSASDKRIDLENNEYIPTAYLICNFAKSNDINKPSCITHNDVTTLFHEMGHGLHHMLTKISENGASGINGVEWDAVELPSQFMENFCWDYNILKNATKHIETGKPLPIELFNKMVAAKNFLSGMFILRQITFSMLDMQAHLAEQVENINKLAKNINNEYHVIPQLDINHWANTFTHVFAGGYAAGYYSYHWAEVLSSDVFSQFEKASESDNNILNQEIGTKYLKEILQMGGSRPALESFIAFVGREPDISAFLKHNGLNV